MTRWIASLFGIAVAIATGFGLVIFYDENMDEYGRVLEKYLDKAVSLVYPEEVQIAKGKKTKPSSNVRQPRGESSPKNPQPIAKRIEVDHMESWNGSLCGSSNYSTVLLLLAPNYELGRFLPMIDLRAHRFDAHNRYAANAGFVGRYVPSNFNQILGFNAYYDWRQAKLGNFQQAGFGIEILSKWWDFRANAYVPIGDKMHIRRCVFDQYIGGYVMERRKVEFISYGFNAEFGYYLVNGNNFSLYAAGGPYYLSGRIDEKAVGGMVRLKPQFKDYFGVNMIVRHDRVFGTVYQAEVIVNIPLYQLFSRKNKKGPGGMYDRQVYQRVERFEMMPVGCDCCWSTNF